MFLWLTQTHITTRCSGRAYLSRALRTQRARQLYGTPLSSNVRWPFPSDWSCCIKCFSSTGWAVCVADRADYSAEHRSTIGVAKNGFLCSYSVGRLGIRSCLLLLVLSKPGLVTCMDVSLACWCVFPLGFKLGFCTPVGWAGIGNAEGMKGHLTNRSRSSAADAAPPVLRRYASK